MSGSAQLAFAIKAVNEASAQLKAVQGDLDTTGQKAEAAGGKTGGFGSALGGVAKIAGGFVLGAGIMQAPGFLMDAAKAAAEDEQATMRLEQSLKNLGGNFDANLAKVNNAITAGQKLAFTDDEVRDSFQFLAAATNDTDEALTRQKAAMDLARGANIPLATATKMLGKLNEENVEVFKKMGIVIGENATEADALAAVQKKFGGQSETYAKSTAGQFEQAKIRMAELKEGIGGFLLPIMTALAGLLMGTVVPAFEKAVGWIGSFVAVIKDSVQNWTDIYNGVTKVQGPLGALQTIVANLTGFIMGLIGGFEEMDVTSDGVVGAGERVGMVFREDILPALKSVLPWLQDLGRVALDIGKVVLQQFLIPALIQLGQLWTGLQPILKTLIDNVLKPVWEILSDHKEIIIALVATIVLINAPWLAVIAVLVLVLAKWDEIKLLFTQTIPQAIDSVITKIRELPVIGEIFDSVWTGIKLIVETAWALIKNYVETGIKVVRDIINIVTALIHGDWDKAWQGVKQLVSDIFDGIKNDIEIKLGFIKGVITTVLGGIKNVFEDVWGLIEGIVMGAVVRVLESIRGMMQTAKDIADAFPGGNPLGNAMQSAIDGMTNVIESAKGDVAASMRSLGRDAVTGLVNGMRSEQAFAESVAAQIAYGIEAEMRAALQSQSPSRVMMAVGMDAVEGLALGMTRSMPEVIAAIYAINKELSSIGEGPERDALKARIEELTQELQDAIKLTLVPSVVETIKQASKEILNGIDDDLDGMIDEGLTNVIQTITGKVPEIIAAMYAVNKAILAAADEATRAQLKEQLAALYKELNDALKIEAGLGPNDQPQPETPPVPTREGSLILPGGEGVDYGTVLSATEQKALSGLLGSIKGMSLRDIAKMVNNVGETAARAFFATFQASNASLFSTENLLNDLRTAGLSFASGGIVPGPIGAPQLALVHGGERITPAGGGGNTYITVQAWDSRDVERWFEANGERIARAGDRYRGRQMR